MEGIMKMVQANKKENDKHRQVAASAGEYILMQTERIKQSNQHALNLLSRELGETKEQLKTALVKADDLAMERDQLKRANADLEFRQNSYLVLEQRLFKTEGELDSAKSELEHTKMQLAESESKCSLITERSVNKFIAGEVSMRKKVEEAWQMGPHESAPFSYFSRRLDYVDRVHTAADAGEAPPSPFQSEDDEEDEDEDAAPSKDDSEDDDGEEGDDGVEGEDDEGGNQDDDDNNDEQD